VAMETGVQLSSASLVVTASIAPVMMRSGV
jgi:hypothetical protein